VYVSGATFTKTGGTIGGASTSGLGNTAKTSGGGVSSVTDGTFTKTGGTIYGDLSANTTHTPGSDENTATSGNGHAAYVSGTKKRNATAGPGDALDSAKTGADGGWE
jgi:predicted outer membrane repeat protein